MRSLITAILLLVALAATAQETTKLTYEVGIGVTHYGLAPDMNWYQRSFPYEISRDVPSAFAGIKVRAGDQWLGFDRWNVRAGYEYLGRVKSDAWATASDADYYRYLAGSGTVWPLSRWRGSGDVHGLYLTAQPERDIGGGYALFLEAGGYIYQARWDMNVEAWRACETCEPHDIHVAHKARWHYNPVLGIGVRKGRWSLAYTLRKAEASGDEFPAVYAGVHSNLTLRWSF